MRIKTENALIFDMGLRGHECQEEFNVDKYKYLAGHPYITTKFLEIIDEHWTGWFEKVEHAPWLRNWTRSDMYTCNVDYTLTPTGRKIECHYVHARIAEALFAEAVWGYGMLDWLGTGSSIENSETCHNLAMKSILALQKVRKPNVARTYMWDDRIYRGCGKLVPCEFGDLDRWLAPLWQQTLIESRHS